MLETRIQSKNAYGEKPAGILSRPEVVIPPHYDKGFIEKYDPENGKGTINHEGEHIDFEKKELPYEL